MQRDSENTVTEPLVTIGQVSAKAGGDTVDLPPGAVDDGIETSQAAGGAISVIRSTTDGSTQFRCSKLELGAASSRLRSPARTDCRSTIERR